MKRLRNSYIITGILLAIIFILPYCTKSDQVLDIPSTTVNSSTDLVSILAATAPAIDGVIDPAWDNVTKLVISPAVPNPGNNLFAGYIGLKFNATLRSMYDNQNIYFLIEVQDKDKSTTSQPWYFNPTTKLWAREANTRILDVNGIVTREGFGEDKFAFLWNIDSSTGNFASQTCYASCHVFSPYIDSAGKYQQNLSGNHYTNAQSEKIDMWWGHPNRGFAFGKMDDEFQDWAGGPTVTGLVGGSGNGRKLDDQVVNGTNPVWPHAPTYTLDATQGSVSNSQNLRLDGDPAKASVAVPIWVVPNATNLEFIKASDTNVTAKKVTGISSSGILTYNGGTIDPNVGTDYQRVGDPVTGGVGPKCIPGNVVSPVKNGRADIDLGAVYTGSSWIFEIKRALKTGDVLKQDVNFSNLADMPFGFAYWDRSNYQHGIRPNLMLKFKK